MTRHARRARQVVVVVDVTIRALARRYGVRTGQNESGGRVIELPVGPGHSVVTLLARCRETGMRDWRCSRVVVSLMATDAGRRRDVVVVVDVTVRTLPRRHGMRTRQNESGGRVIELAIRPGHGVVTLRAGCRETGVRHRRGRRVVVGLVATDAGGRGDVVVVVDVTVRALARRHRVRARQREPGCGMVKRCRLPCSGVVARLASLRESAAHVIRIRRALEILQVTRHTGRTGQVVVVADVAIDALARRHGMRTRQNESGRGVIELAIGPGHGVMTLRARGWETGMRNRRGRGVVVGLMATDAGGCGDIEVVIYVTVRTLPRRNRMRTAQNESGARVIELAIRPGHGVMTLRAGCRETGVRHRRGRGIVVGLMATDAGGRGDIEVIIDVAVRTLPRRNRVRTGQRESGRRVIELCVSPLHGVMALLACSREPGVCHRGYGVVEIILVAADAGRAGDVEIVIDVAIRTLPRGNRVCTRQRKPRFRVIERRRLPGCGGVAGFASLRESPAHVVRVRGSLEIFQVTRHAGRAGQVVVVVDVAIGALPRRNRMRAGQHKIYRGVIETGRLPTRSSVALQAIRGEVGRDVVRISRALKILKVAG